MNNIITYIQKEDVITYIGRKYEVVKREFSCSTMLIKIHVRCEGLEVYVEYDCGGEFLEWPIREQLKVVCVDLDYAFRKAKAEQSR